MSSIFLTVTANTQPNLALTLERDGAAINLSGATVSLIITDADTGEVTNSGHQSCTITSAVAGTITYTATATDFTDEGRYTGEVLVNYGGSNVERLFEKVIIVARPATS